MADSKNSGASAKAKGKLKKARRHRAERRDATTDVREKVNEQKRAEGHPGWVEQPSSKAYWLTDTSDW